MLIASPRASLPTAALIIYFTQSANAANRPHIYIRLKGQVGCTVCCSHTPMMARDCIIVTDNVH